MAKLKLNIKKIDFGGVKQFLLARGEKVALAVALLVGVLLVGKGLLAARSVSMVDGKSITELLNQGAKNMKDSIDGAPAISAEGKVFIPPWDDRLPTFRYTSIMALNESGDFKRRNPSILAVPGNDAGTNIQIDYILRGILANEINITKQQVLVFNQANAGGAGGQPMPMPKQPMNVGGNAGGAFEPIKIQQPRRMIVVHASFPIKAQLLEFAKELRMPLTDLLQRREDLPKFRGLDVYRVEHNAKGEVTETKLYWYDGKNDLSDKNKIQLAPHIEMLLKESLIDEGSLAGLDNYYYQNLMTPLPKLAHGVWPAVNLGNIKVDVAAAEEGDPTKPMADPMKAIQIPIGGRPKPPPMPNPMQVAVPNTPAVGTKTVGWAKVSTLLAKKYEGDIMPFDPLGGPYVDEKANGAGVVGMPPNMAPNMQGKPGAPPVPRQFNMPPNGVMPPFRMPPMGMPPVNMPPMGMPPMGLPKPMNPMGDPKVGEQPDPLLNQNFPDALIRFLDTDVEPGKTYSYKFRVRCANPNWGRKAEVAFTALAEVRELTSPWTFTPTLSVPGETFVYVTDQVEDPRDPKKRQNRGPDTGALEDRGISYAPIQIQRWIGKTTDKEGMEHSIADWVIAERLLVRRGEYLGRRDVIVQVPAWDKFKGEFAIPNTVTPKKGLAKSPTGVQLDLTLGNPPPLLIDFEGGPRGKVASKEESAFELLILTPDGKLEVRSSVQDTEDERRKERYENYRARLTQVQAAETPANPNPMGITIPITKPGMK